MNNEKKLITKTFIKKDFYFNNGLVNLYSYLCKNNTNEIQYVLTNNELIIKYNEDVENEVYNMLLKDMIIENKIVFQTDNDRIYWDRDKNEFAIEKKYDVKGKASGNDVKYLYKYMSSKDVGITTEEWYKIFLDFANEVKMSDKEIKAAKGNFIDSKGKYKEEAKCKIPIYITQNEAAKSYMEFLLSDDTLKMDSKIHQFEDGGFCFHDMISNKEMKIDKWDALIYWYGVRIKRFYISSYFIYPNSIDLLALYDLKRNLIINENNIQVRNQESNEVKELQTNVDFYEQLLKDNIKNYNFYISNSIQEVQLKFFIYLFSYLYHIENAYEKNIRRKRIENLYANLLKISFITYLDEAMKSTLNEYTKVSKLMLTLNELKNFKYGETTLFKYLTDLITYISLSKPKDVLNINIRDFCDNLLNFKGLRRNYYEASYDILRDDKKASLGNGLYDFECIYLKNIGRGVEEMSLHEKSKILGEQIGTFCAQIEDKDLLFRLRNVKNNRQMVSYFKDLKFVTLKKQDEARFNSDFDVQMEEILNIMEEKPDNWEIIRDYIAIYAINKYKVVIYAKNATKGGK